MTPTARHSEFESGIDRDGDDSGVEDAILGELAAQVDDAFSLHPDSPGVRLGFAVGAHRCVAYELQASRADLLGY